MAEKPGWKTTEFWLALVLTLAGVAVPLAIYYGVPQEEAELWHTAVVAVAPAVAAGWAVSSYAKSRAEVKSAAQRNQ